jgi:hypothetical protein
MSSGRRDYSPVDRGYVRIEKRPDGLHTVTVLRTPDSTAKTDVVSIHLKCKQIDVDRSVRLVESDGSSHTEVPVVVYQSFRTKTVVIQASDPTRPD